VSRSRIKGGVGGAIQPDKQRCSRCIVRSIELITDG
jgi:hypothetical protein